MTMFAYMIRVMVMIIFACMVRVMVSAWNFSKFCPFFPPRGQKNLPHGIRCLPPAAQRHALLLGPGKGFSAISPSKKIALFMDLTTFLLLCLIDFYVKQCPNSSKLWVIMLKFLPSGNGVHGMPIAQPCLCMYVCTSVRFLNIPSHSSPLTPLRLLFPYFFSHFFLPCSAQLEGPVS